MNKVALRNFKAKELDLFVAIVSRMRDKEEEKITFSFDYLRELINYENSNSIEAFYKDLKSMYDKLIKCVWGWENEKEIVRFVLFTEYVVDKDTQTVKIEVNKNYTWVLNALTTGLFTRFELNEFVALKSSYTKEFFRHMKQYKSTGIWRVSLEEFRRLFDIPKSYRMSHIDIWVFKPILEELGEKYKLKIQKIYGKSGGRGRSKITGFEFTFLKEDLQKKMENVDPKEINLKNYIGRKVRVEDEKFNRYNVLTIMELFGEDLISGILQNVDDGYVNEWFFNSKEHFVNWFEKYKI